jgi:hypothetical protein
MTDLSEDVDALLEGIGDPEGARDGDDDDEDDEAEWSSIQKFIYGFFF